ncbi:MAG: NAD(P)/FAD-dependent oxidoreductase, partial [Gemmatimonadales bacterium]
MALCVLSRDRWDELAPQLPAGGELDRCGTIWVAAAADELAVAEQRAIVYHAAGIGAEVISAADLRRLEPALAPHLAGGLLVPGDSVCYPPAIAHALSERIAAGGGMVRVGAAVRAVRSHAVDLDDGTSLRADAIVVAAGVQSPALIPELPVVPRKGHLVISDRRPGMVHHQVVEQGYLKSAHSFGGASVAFNVQPRRTGQMLIGSSRELVGLDPRVNRRVVDAMLARAAEFLPGIDAVRALRTWVGFRPATADKLPLIGRWPALDGVWIATGHEGLGITMSTGTADLIVSAVLNTAPPIDPAPFRPDRTMPALAAA